MRRRPTRTWPVAVDVLANDHDADGDPLTVVVVGPPTHGGLTLAEGTLTYTPADEWNGTDEFTYRACDPTDRLRDGQGGRDGGRRR